MSSWRSVCWPVARTRASHRFCFIPRGRADDNLDVIKKRFYSYEHETKEVLDKLRQQVQVSLGNDG